MDGLALGRREIEPMQDEAQECLHIAGVQCPNCSVSRCVPLEKIAFRFKMLILGIAPCGRDHGNFPMCLYKLCLHLSQKPDGLFREGEQLAFFVRFGSFGQQQLEVEFDLPEEWLAIFCELGSPVIPEHGHLFRTDDPAFFVEADLEQFIHPAAIRESNGRECRSHHNASRETFRLKNEFFPSFCRARKPGVSWTEETWSPALDAIGKSELACIVPACLISFQMEVIGIKALQKMALNEIPKPQTVGGRAVK